jgi:hypothetical protein
LSDLQIRTRQQFVLDWNGPLDEEIRARPLVFTDESRFCKRSDSHWVWRRRGVYTMSILAPTEKFARISIMVWGAIHIGSKSPLILIGGAIAGNGYLGILGSFFTNCDDQLGHLQWVLMQDGASPHTVPRTIAGICDPCELMPSWPANSLDVNPIEMVWGSSRID